MEIDYSAKGNSWMDKLKYLVKCLDAIWDMRCAQVDLQSTGFCGSFMFRRTRCVERVAQNEEPRLAIPSIMHPVDENPWLCV